MRNKRPDLNGILIIDKPLRWTSAQVCQFVRRRSGGAKVGHAGTLDPLASGVLVLCLGRATKQIDSLMATHKRYTARVDLAHTSATDDLEATPDAVAIAAPPTADDVRAALVKFIGRIAQTPPAHSAIWVDGVRSYNLARRGEAVELKSREIDIHSIDMLDYEWPIATLDIRCGKGTYIRSLARDLGRELGAGGMLAGLIRTEVGVYTLAHSATVEQIDESREVERFVLPLETAPPPAPTPAPAPGA